MPRSTARSGASFVRVSSRAGSSTPLPRTSSPSRPNESRCRHCCLTLTCFPIVYRSATRFTSRWLEPAGSSSGPRTRDSIAPPRGSPTCVSSRDRELVGDGPHLDDAACGPAIRDGDGLFLILDLDDRVAAHRLLRLHERTVADHRQVFLADTTEADGLGSAPESVALDDLSRAGVFREPLADVGDPSLPLALGQRHPLVLDRVEGEHVTHGRPPRLPSFEFHGTDERRHPGSTKTFVDRLEPDRSRTVCAG